LLSVLSMKFCASFWRKYAPCPEQDRQRADSRKSRALKKNAQPQTPRPLRFRRTLARPSIVARNETIEDGYQRPGCLGRASAGYFVPFCYFAVLPLCVQVSTLAL